MKPLSLFDHPKIIGYGEALAKSLNYKYIIGVDEAGRGPLAGPVVAAALFFDENYIKEVNDSKKLSESKREEFFKKIIASSYYGIGSSSSIEIDNLNILKATHLAMNRAIEELKNKINKIIDIVLVDGNLSIKQCEIEQIPIVKGDSLSYSIAGASILAKVTRDNYMKKLSKKYPNYGFEKHKGYPTKEHINAINKYGIIDEHRKTFSPVKEMI